MSLQNAFNLDLMINPTNREDRNSFTRGTPPSLHCGTPQCNFHKNISGLCNNASSPGYPNAADRGSCVNFDGPNNTEPTHRTLAFEGANNECTDGMTYSTDLNKIYDCQSGPDYEVVFCP